MNLPRGAIGPLGSNCSSREVHTSISKETLLVIFKVGGGGGGPDTLFLPLDLPMQVFHNLIVLGNCIKESHYF